MKFLLFGAKGQVGTELQRSLQPLGEVVACDQEEIDLTNLKLLASEIQNISPSVIINAAAYTAVDKAESEPEIARVINADAVGVMAQQAEQLGIPLVHYSTDYVFDGTNSAPSLEDDETSPLSVYGETKLQGERAIRHSNCQHLIFRTSWVYSTHGANFAKTMLRLASERDELSVVSDQVGVPTSASLIADITAECLDKSEQEAYRLTHTSGTYHLVPSGETNWFEFAKRVISNAAKLGEVFRITPDAITPILTEAYPTPAKRPSNSLLGTEKLTKTFRVYLPPWEHDVDHLVGELIQGIKI
jgi:dTDP-4-dehydrorhamnose reductase